MNLHENQRRTKSLIKQHNYMPKWIWLVNPVVEWTWHRGVVIAFSAEKMTLLDFFDKHIRNKDKLENPKQKQNSPPTSFLFFRKSKKKIGPQNRLKFFCALRAQNRNAPGKIIFLKNLNRNAPPTPGGKETTGGRHVWYSTLACPPSSNHTHSE